MEGLESREIYVANAITHTIARRIGPFSDVVRPFTINGRQTLVFANVNSLLGFEVGDLQSGRMLWRVPVQGYTPGWVRLHSTPSHGIALSPDQRQVWVVDAANRRVHLFDATVMPPRQFTSILLRDQPGWVTFSIDGRYAYPSTGDVIDTRTRTIVARLTDEQGQAVQSEKMLEVVFRDGRPIAAGDQFGVGRVR
jgi:DNA-binding beta-propeller fold protein YncE